MINKIITDSSFYNIAKSSKTVATSFSDLIATSNDATKKSSNVANKYIDTVQQFSNTTKSGKSVSNTYNNAVKNYDSIAKNSIGVANSSNSENSATQNVDPDEYNIPKSMDYYDSGGTLNLNLNVSGDETGIIYRGGTFASMIFDLRYAEHSTDENPIISARGYDENKKEFTQLITVNKINPSNATPVEIIALRAYLSGGRYYEGPEHFFLMGGDIGYDEHGYHLNDRNNYTLSLEINIDTYSFPTYDSPEVPIGLSKTLDSFKEFMSKNNMDYPDHSLEIKNIYAQKAIENMSYELNDLSESMIKDKGDLDDEFLKLLDENKEDNNDK